MSREQILGGEELLRQLPIEGASVTGAARAKADGDGQPYLYVISPTVEIEGPLLGARRLVVALDELDKRRADPFRRLDPFAIKLIGPSESLALGIQFEYGRYSGPVPTWYGGSLLGGVPVEGAYIYPATMFAAPAPAAPRSA